MGRGSIAQSYSEVSAAASQIVSPPLFQGIVEIRQNVKFHSAKEWGPPILAAHSDHGSSITSRNTSMSVIHSTLVPSQPLAVPPFAGIGASRAWLNPLRFVATIIAAGTGFAFAQTSVPTPTKTAVSAGAPTAFPGGDFEMTSIATYQYRPVWQDWTMTGGSVIAKNASAFTSGNPSAPAGVYCAILQNGATMKRNHTFTAGTWRLRYFAAQRKVSGVGNQQAFRITVGGVEVGEEEPAHSPSTDYKEYVTRPFTVPAGAREVNFTSFNPNGGDNSVLIDNIRLEPIPLWTSAATWTPSGAPAATDNVSVPAGVEVAISGTCVAATVNVAGELLATNADGTLSSRWVLVDGAGSAFEVGTPGSPFEQNFTLTLTGNQTSESIMGGGTKFLMSMDDGYIDLHGKPQVSWTRLSATAAVGAAQITLADAVAWNVGDQIVIAPSTKSANESEVRSITGRSADGKTLTLNAALTYRHYGVRQNFTRPSDGRTWTLDQRAEVGLLTHNVKVQGDAGSETTKFGGHIMVMFCPSCSISGYARMSSVELYRMGQKQVLGRYPMHWHMLGASGAGQYLTDSSVHHSFNRAVTIHGSESVTVERNVAYDHIGHGIFLEDGSERFNRINYNLAFGTIKPAPGEQMLPSDNSHNEPQNRSPSTFWITNPNNEMIGNVAAGTVNGSLTGATCGTGFWFAFPQSPTGLSGSDPRFSALKPYQQPLGVFRGNMAHSNMSGFDTNDSINADHTLVTNVGWDPPAAETLEDFTCYSNDIAFYAGIGNSDTFYSGAVLADNVNHLFLAAYQTVSDSLIVADGGGTLLPASATRTVYVPYDGAGRLRNSHLVGFDQSNTNFIGNVGAATKHTNHIFSGLTYNHAGRPRTVLPDYAAVVPEYSVVNSLADPRLWGTVVRDEDGTAGNGANRSIITNHPFIRTSSDTTISNWTRAYVSVHKFGLLKLNYPGAATIPDVNITREKSGESTITYVHRFKVDPHHQVPAIVNNTYQYGFVYPTLPANRKVTVTADDLGAGDVTLVRLNAIGARPGLAVSGWTRHTSLASLQASTTSGFYVDASGHLWLRFVNTGKSNSAAVVWSS